MAGSEPNVQTFLIDLTRLNYTESISHTKCSVHVLYEILICEYDWETIIMYAF